MKFVEFSILSNRIIISATSEEELRKIIKALKEFGIELDEELNSLCG